MSEYVTLVSNVKCVSQYGKNTIAEFKTQLGRKFSLVGDWVVGVAEVSYTKSWYNVLFPHKIILFDEMGTVYNNEDFTETNDILNTSDELHISSGYYESARKLVDEINIVLGKITTIIAPKLEYNELNNTVTVMPGLIDNAIKVYPFFGTEVENILGLKNRNMKNNYYSQVNQSSGIAAVVFKGDEMYKQNKFLAFHPVEISGGYHSLFVYSDIVYPSYIGDTCTQILRVVEIPRKAKFGEQCVIKYENPQYRRLLLNEFESIEISIKDDSGELIPFKFGRVIITLHFKKL
jgi:hypothetical protein